MLDAPFSLEEGSLAQRRDRLRTDFDVLRRRVILEPRGNEVLVGALVLPPESPDSTAGVIFFNNVGYLGMCGHGLIGVVTTLTHVGRLKPGTLRFDTPVGTVQATLHEDLQVTIDNVASYRIAAGVTIDVPNHGRVTGDIAWGGNGFFLSGDHGIPLTIDALPRLLALSRTLRDAVLAAGFSEIDHVELFGPPGDPKNHGRNFVLCPGGAYDRSPCGTGTSAKLACLAADGALAPGTLWRQEGILGTVFEGRYRPGPDGTVLPSITGRASITAETTLLFDPDDPFVDGIGA